MHTGLSANLGRPWVREEMQLQHRALLTITVMSAARLWGHGHEAGEGLPLSPLQVCAHSPLCTYAYRRAHTGEPLGCSHISPIIEPHTSSLSCLCKPIPGPWLLSLLPGWLLCSGLVPGTLRPCSLSRPRGPVKQPRDWLLSLSLTVVAAASRPACLVPAPTLSHPCHRPSAPQLSWSHS